MMLKKILRRHILMIAAIVSISVAGVAHPVYAAATDVLDQSCHQAGSAGSALCKGRGDKLFGPNSLFNNIINALIYVIGAVAVLMVVIGGLRYVISGGDSGAITSAKNTILYAVVGIIIALMAYSIVNFVIARF